MRSQSSCIAILVAMNLFWAGSYAVIKYGLDQMDPLVLVFWRLVVGLAVLTLWILAKGYSINLDRRDLVRIAMAGLFLAAASFLTVTGIEMSFATDASLLYAFEPIWGIVLASLILKERFLISTGIGLALVLAGLLGLAGFDVRTLLGIGGGVVGLGNMIMVVGLLAESLFTGV
jgi:drug/metabolite transporter (DMT)-like permease